jgi:hypothetical protein
MKLSSIILSVMLALFITSLFASTLILKERYKKVDKSDLYWNFDKISTKTFKHIKIRGGNVTTIAFEQNKNCSVRVLDFWSGYEKNHIRTSVSHDTLYLEFENKYNDLLQKAFLSSRTLVRIAAPELLSIDGFNTNFAIEKLEQKSMDINLSGKSRIDIESNTHVFDNLNINQKDSSQVIIEMNPDLKESPIIRAKVVKATLKGVSLLDIGHITSDKSHLNIGDSAAVILSGQSIMKINGSKDVKK